MEQITSFKTYTQAIAYYLSVIIDTSCELEKPTALTRIGHCLTMIEQQGNTIKDKGCQHD